MKCLLYLYHFYEIGNTFLEFYAVPMALIAHCALDAIHGVVNSDLE